MELTWRRSSGAILVAVSAWWLGGMIAHNWGELRRFEWRADPVLLAASVVAHTAEMAFGVWVWSRVLRRFDHPPVRLATLQRIWLVSNLARYLPGKVFQFLLLARMSRSAGLAGGVMLTSVLVQAGLALVCAAVVVAWTLAADVFTGVNPRWVAICVTGAALLAVHPGFLNRLLAIVPRLLRKDVIRWNAGWADGVALLALTLLNWLLYGISYHLFVVSLTPVPWRLLPEMVGVNALSFLVGYGSPLPGGAGLREVSMAALLTPYLPDGVAAVLAITSRLWAIAGELLGGGLALLLVRGRAVPVEADGAADQVDGVTGAADEMGRVPGAASGAEISARSESRSE